jgi:uncharacterized protein YdaU (DUF1376 family)
MSLPWFAFHIDKFLSDTLGLDGPAIGAYTLLILHYYATEKPPRDHDRTLATIARLPMDVWIERRPEIECFFQIHDGAWHHATIEAEIAEAKLKHSAGIARASAGGLARWGKTTPKPATSKARAVPQASSELAVSMKTTQSTAQAKPEAQRQAVPEQCPGNAHLHLHKEESLSVSVLTVDKDNSGDNSDTAPDLEEAGDQEEALGTPIDPQFWPCENHRAVCEFDGADEPIIAAEVRKFIATHQERATFSHDWDASWTKWWERWKDHRDALAAKANKAKPRVEVSKTVDWDAHAKRWAGGMGWPRGVGGEPGAASCRCPADVLLDAGVDPDTGLKLTAVQLALRAEKLTEKV